MIRDRNDGRILGLVACKQAEEVQSFRLKQTDSGMIRYGGFLVRVRDHFDYSGHLESLFVLVKFEPMMNEEIDRKFKVAAISKNFRVNAFNRNGMKVRRIVGSHKPSLRKTRTNSRGNRQIYRGLVCGDVTNAKITVSNTKTRVQYAGLIRNKTDVSFAKLGDGGKPVVSSSNALLGFVVASSDDKTLMLTAEDISKDLDVDFLVPDKYHLPQSDDIQIRTK